RAEARHRAGGPSRGLRRGRGGWACPRVATVTGVDGSLDDWDLPAAWAPGTMARSPFLPFGDFYLSWAPNGLLVGVVYNDYSTGSADPAVPASLSRLSLAVERAGAEPFVATLAAFPGPKGKAPRIEPLAEDGQPVARRARLVRAAHGASSLTTIAEVLVPAAALGGAPLAAGERLRVGATARQPGDSKEIGWPQVWGGPRPRPRMLADIVLAEAGS
ncbi:MAG: hypothetical protein AAB368_15370, partial [bacterium]